MSFSEFFQKKRINDHDSFSHIGKVKESMAMILFCSWEKFDESMVKKILNGRSMTQIHLGFGRKIISVGVHQERLLMVESVRFVKDFGLSMEIIDGP
jgi:hypothetical protein